MNRYVLGPFLRRVRGEAVDRKDPSLEPTVAIIVPLYNEGEGIYRTVLSLAQQEYPREKLEVVVVDDCSTDDSYAWAARAAPGRPPDHRCCAIPRIGQAQGHQPGGPRDQRRGRRVGGLRRDRRPARGARADGAVRQPRDWPRWAGAPSSRARTATGSPAWWR